MGYIVLEKLVRYCNCQQQQQQKKFINYISI